eukprot:scaffold80810_cov17-Tisochrysis_lutea.AAC.1
MNDARSQMTHNFMGGIARVLKAGAELVFALTAGLYQDANMDCRPALLKIISKKNKAQDYYRGFLKSPLGVYETLEFSPQHKPLLRRLVQADLQLADKEGSWPY